MTVKFDGRQRSFRAVLLGSLVLATIEIGPVHATEQSRSAVRLLAERQAGNADAAGSSLTQGDDELSAWFKAARQVQAALDRTNPGPYGVDAARWLQDISECPTTACARLRLQDWLRDLTYPEARPAFSISGAKIYRASRGGRSHATLKMLSLGDDWRLVIFEAATPSSAGRTDIPPVAGGDVFVARQRGATLHYRDANGNGYDMTRVGLGWRVTQAGACTCGPHLTLAGDYR